MAGAIYLADTSVFVLQSRHPQVHRRFAALLCEGRPAACPMVALEYLNNAPDPRSYEALWGALRGMRCHQPSDGPCALAVHRELAATGQHRNFRLPDLIIAAAAECNGATVRHYDADYDRIAKITQQPTEWVADSGSL